MTGRPTLRLVTPPPPAPPIPEGYASIPCAAALRMSSVAARVHAAQRAFLGSFTTGAMMERVKADLAMAEAEIALVRRDLERAQ